MNEASIYRFALENLNDTTLITNMEGDFSFICPNVHLIFGYSREEVNEMGNIRRLIANIPSPSSLVSGNKIINHELHIQTKDNEERVLLLNLKSFDFDEDICLYSFRDITGIKTNNRRSSDVLKRNNLLDQLANNLPMVFWIWARDFNRVLYVSPLFETYWGVSSEELKKNPLSWIDFLHETDIEKLRSFIRSTNSNNFKGISSISFPSFRLRCADGQLRWLKTKAFPIEGRNGDTRLLAGYSEDVTLQKSAQANLILVQQRLRALWDIYSIDDRDKKTICSSILKKIVQMTGSMYGFYGFIHEDEGLVRAITWSIEQIKAGRVNNDFIEFKIPKSGVWAKPIQDRKPFMDNDFDHNFPPLKGFIHGHVDLNRVLYVPVILSGKVIALGAIANKKTDYTQDDVDLVQNFLTQAQIIIDRKEKELALNKAHEELELRVQERTKALAEAHQKLVHTEKLAGLGRLAATFSHEFNNPLYGVMNVLSGLQRYACLTPHDADLVKMALQECTRMKILTDNLIIIGRPNTGKKVWLNIHEIIDSVLTIFTRKDKNTPVTFHKRYCQDMPLAMLAPDLIKQVVLNLVSNAVEACENQKNIEISIQTKASDKTVSFSVADNGKGIEKEKLNEIFEPFYTTKPVLSMAGLGLSVSDSIVKHLGGSIDVFSTPGIGTTFTITLPLDPAPPVLCDSSLPTPVFQQDENLGQTDTSSR